MGTSRHALLLALASLSSGCGLVLDLAPEPEGVDASVRDAGAPDAGRDDGGDPRPDAAPMDAGGSDAAPPADAGPRDASRPDAGSDAGGACPGLLPGQCYDRTDCSGDEFCLHPAGDCLARGTCVTPPTDCAAISDPVCGCTGRTFSNACEAAAAETSVAAIGGCSPSLGGGPDDWCAAAEAPADSHLPCGTIFSPCFDDADCRAGGGSLFTDCIGATGCTAGHEGVCVGPAGTGGCFRDDQCPTGESCVGAEISAFTWAAGRCESR